MKTARIRNKTYQFLKDRKPRSITEIIDFINTTTRHGTTTQQMGNVLSKDRHILKTGKISKSGIACSTYSVSQWTLSEEKAAELQSL